MSMPAVALAPHATPVDDLRRLRAALGPTCPRLLMKRDDLLSFGLGGNKVRKMQAVAAEAIAAGADMLITCGGVQSNHARVTAAAGAVLGLGVVLVINRTAEGPPPPPTGNARLDRLFGAEVEYVPSRDARARRMTEIAERRRAEGRKPFVVPLGASTATGALGFARGVQEIAAAGVRPDVIVHATSSGGTQAGLIAGCALFGLRPRILGISADDPAPVLSTVVDRLLDDMAARLSARRASVSADLSIEVDDSFVGGGYGVPTPASTEALELVARREGILLDPVYTSKAMAGLIARVRRHELTADQTVLFWHTGGTPGYFADNGAMGQWGNGAMGQ
jgi:1-aminocyclopropane-1-carboxylate deaminase/D-cysteine desulfhydrase-like pyridoxal-dependent ACC family enzyme